jgi:hypothetical protein
LPATGRATGKKQKKSATPEGCAEVPPKEEVLEDLRRHLRRCPTRNHYVAKQPLNQAFSAALQYKLLQRTNNHINHNII